MPVDVFCYDNNVPDYVPKDCGVERAGIVGVAFIDKSQTPTDVNLADATFWGSTQSTSPKYYHIIQATRGEYNGGTPTEEDGFGLEDKQISDAEHVVNIEVEGLLYNRSFWETVNRRKWVFAFVTNAGNLFYVDKPVTVYATPMNPKSIKANAFWKIQVKWSQYSNPRIVAAPEGIFAPSGSFNN